MNDILLSCAFRHKDDMNVTSRESQFAYLAGASAPTGTRQRKALIVATVILWAAAWALLTAKAIADGGTFLALPSALRAGLAAFGCLQCLVIEQILERVRFRTFVSRVIAGAVLAAVAAEILGWLSVGLSWLALGTAGKPSPGMTILILGFYAWVFFSWVTIYLALTYSSQAMDAERRATRAGAEATSAQLRALRYQLNPHFLFNTLNSLSALILEQRTADADRMVVRLSSFLRTSLATEGSGEISAEEEVEAQRRYLEIEQVRFPDLRLRTLVEPCVARAAVPPLILQPLVENAIRYSVSANPDPAEISVSASRDGEFLKLSVSDSGTKLPKPHQGLGVGLRNVRDRLRTLYGDRASLRTERSPGGGYTAVVSLPLERAPC
jgi:two-component system, LytTR family, sensor kinase